jgi:hypothetical protein
MRERHGAVALRRRDTRVPPRFMAGEVHRPRVASAYGGQTHRRRGRSSHIISLQQALEYYSDRLIRRHDGTPHEQGV